MTITVFTTVLGQTDPLRPPTVVNPDRRIKYVCFADDVAKVRPPYRYVPYLVDPAQSRLESRRLKILADHPALERPQVTLWHDAAFQLQSDPAMLVRQHLATHDVLAFKHPHRGCIEDEAEVIARLGYAPRATVEAQAAAYRAAGFPVRDVITSTGFCLRRMNEAVAAFCRRWWAEVERWTYRDQMSVDFALWQSHVDVRYIPGHYRDNPFARWYPEPKRRPPLVRRPRPLLPLARYVRCPH